MRSGGGPERSNGDGGLITWHPDMGVDGSAVSLSSNRRAMPEAAGRPQEASGVANLPEATVLPPASKSRRSGAGATTQIGYVDKHQQKVIGPTGKPGTDHGQYVYVLRCRRAVTSMVQMVPTSAGRCPAHDGWGWGQAI